MLFERRHIPAGVLGQIAERSHVVDRLRPAWELVVDGGRAREGGAARGPGIDAASVDLVGDADPQPLDAGQDVELVEHDRRDAVDRDRVSERNGVEPADATWPPGHRAVFVAALGDAVADPVEQLSRVWAGPVPRR